MEKATETVVLLLWTLEVFFMSVRSYCLLFSKFSPLVQKLRFSPKNLLLIAEYSALSSRDKISMHQFNWGPQNQNNNLQLLYH